MILGSRIDKRFIDASLETCQVDDGNRKAIEYAKQMVAGEFDGGIILGGPVGTGKTHIMVATLNDIDAANEPVMREMENGLEAYTPWHTYYYWKAVDLATALREAVSNGNDPAGDAKRSELLFVDDLGTEYEKAGSDFVYAAFQAIFDYRWANLLPIFVTTNMDAAAIERAYGDRVLSRWRGSCKMLRLDGDDRRKDERFASRIQGGTG